MDSASDSISSATQQKNPSKPISGACLGNIQPEGFPPLPPGWTTETETFPSADGAVKLFAAIHRSPNPKPVGRPFRALFVTHGLNEHGGRYLHVPHYLQDTVDLVYCFDQRGHGRSEGLPGHVDRFVQYTDDLAAAIARLDERVKKERGKGTYEVHLLAHSMGGLVALRTLFLHPSLPLKSVTVTSPLLGIAVPLPTVKVMAARLLSSVWGSLHMESEIDPSLLSRDPAVGKAYMRDRLVHHKGTPRLYTELQAAIRDTRSRQTGFGNGTNYPLLIVVSLEDKIVDPNQTLEFFKNLKHRDKELKTYAGYYHECLNEIGKEKIFEDIRQWIIAHP